MENKIQKCNSIRCYEIVVVAFCQECRIYMCQKCSILHSNNFKGHHVFNLKKNIDIFTGIKKDQQVDLIYFCKEHNELCCACCISKIKTNDFGQHNNCKVCTVQEIINEKKII